MRTKVKFRLWILFATVLVLPGLAAAEQDNDKLVKVAKGCVSALAREDFAGAVEQFDAIMKEALPQIKLQAVWNSIIAQTGPFEKQLGVRKEKIGPSDVVFVTCKFKNAVLDAKVVFNSKQQIAGLFFVPSQQTAQAAAESRQPDYVKPDAFREIETKVGSGPQALPGTLTLPNGPGPFPGVVLVHGSGPHDRDETIGPNKPFRDLAWGLASQGIAVLRYDKRTKMFPAEIAGQMDRLTVKEETIDDALVAVATLRGNQRIDARKIFVLGHSLGGYLIPRIGQGDRRIAGFIIMAGNTRPMEDLVVEQFEYIYSLDGTVTETEKAHLVKLRFQALKPKDPKLSVARFSPAELPLGLPKAYWLDLRDYDPAVEAAKLAQPILILQGGRDYQVT